MKTCFGCKHLYYSPKGGYCYLLKKEIKNPGEGEAKCPLEVTNCKSLIGRISHILKVWKHEKYSF